MIPVNVTGLEPPAAYTAYSRLLLQHVSPSNKSPEQRTARPGAFKARIPLSQKRGLDLLSKRACVAAL
jgi:hypothetical protein